MGKEDPFIAPVESAGDNLAICRNYFGEKIIKAWREPSNAGDRLLRNLGAYLDEDNNAYYLAVNPETGETGAQVANKWDFVPIFSDYIKVLRVLDPEITPAQALTSLIPQSVFQAEKNLFPTEFSQLQILSFPLPELTALQEFFRNF